MVMTATTFKSRSNIFMHRRKSGIINDIDVLLNEYEKTISENRKLKCLVCIYMLCKLYLFTKSPGKRGGAVDSLLTEVRAELDLPKTRASLNSKVGGRHYNQGTEGHVGTAMGRSSIPMDHNYGIEGILPQKNFLQKMHLNLESVLSRNEKYTGMTNLGIHDGLQFSISQILDRLHDMWTDPNDPSDFEYLNSSQRVDLMSIIRNGFFYNFKSGSLINTHGLYAQYSPQEPYAMDTEERLYCTQRLNFGLSNFNHSSFLSGHPVICAGFLWIENGKLKSISNDSGHYKPKTDNLVDCVLVLAKDISPDTFSVFDMSDRARKYDTARQFVVNNRGGGNMLL